MEFLGITGVEDLLQDEIRLTLESLMNAGIKIWMLTGDKVETAICIAISAGLKSRMHELFTIKKIEDEKEITQKLEQFHYMNNTVLVIDGSTLEVILRKEELKKLFYLASSKAPSVICCRCSPK